jgi:hypothetical protein
MSNHPRAVRHGAVVFATASVLAVGCAELAGLGDFGDAGLNGSGGSNGTTTSATAGGNSSSGGQGGQAGGGGAAACSDGIDCTVDTMGPEGCAHTPDDSLCDDGFACTSDVCGADGCNHGTDDAACDDGNPCTTGNCDEAQGCVQTAVADDTGCGDGKCDEPFQCMSGSCAGTLTCPGQSVCDPAGVCTGCTGDADCPSAVVGAWSACSCSGECTTSGMRQRSVTTFSCASGTFEQVVTVEPEACNCDTEDAPCTDDGNHCTNDLCKNGVCSHIVLGDGTQCGLGQNFLCCGGSCKYTQEDDQHCGGCYVVCQGTLGCDTGYCRSCNADGDCTQNGLAGFTCNTSQNADRCQCSDDASCPMPWQDCNASHKCR